MKYQTLKLIEQIARGENFTLDFDIIDVIRRGSIIKRVVRGPGNPPIATFRKGCLDCDFVTTLEFSENVNIILNDSGALQGIESMGFDMYFPDPWKRISRENETDKFIYNIWDNGIDKFEISGKDDVNEISLQIYMTNGSLICLKALLSNHSPRNRQSKREPEEDGQNDIIENP